MGHLVNANGIFDMARDIIYIKCDGLDMTELILGYPTIVQERNYNLYKVQEYKVQGTTCTREKSIEVKLCSLGTQSSIIQQRNYFK